MNTSSINRCTMLLILLSCLAICSATDCNLPEAINKTIDLKDLVGTWYVQYTQPGSPQNPYKCWKNVIEESSNGYEITSTSTDPNDDEQLSVKSPLALVSSPGNIIRAKMLHKTIKDVDAEFTVLGLLPDQYVIYGACLPDDILGYYIETVQASPSSEEMNEIEDALQKLNLSLSDFTKNCESPYKYQ